MSELIEKLRLHMNAEYRRMKDSAKYAYGEDRFAAFAEADGFLIGMQAAIRIVESNTDNEVKHG